MSPNPTVVVGVGQAGINVLSSLHSIVTADNERESYRFIAIDSDDEFLHQAPRDITRLALSIDEDFIHQDRQEYHYLTQKLSIPPQGTARQRPLGRYILDNRGVPGFDTIFRKLKDEITDHVSGQKASLGGAAGSFDIFLVNSLGGGTGSGAYPLLLGMLNEIKETLVQNQEIDIYLSGVGFVPKVTFDVAAGRGDAVSDGATFFPNTYAALSDLEKLTELTANRDESVSIPIYAQMYGPGHPGLPEEIRLDEPPFDDYWLIDVDESEMAGGSGGSTGFESYRENVNTQVARSIQGISKCNARRFLRAGGGGGIRNRPYAGGFEQGEIEVPHDRVKAFLELKAEHGSIRNRLTEEIPERLADLRDERDRLRRLKKDLDSASVIEDSSIGTDIQSRIEQQLGSPATIDEHTDPGAIETLLDEVQKVHGLEGVITALDVLDEKLHDGRGLSAVEESRADIVQELWRKYDMGAKDEFSDSSPRSLDTQADAVGELIQLKIEEYTSVLESWDPTPLEDVRDAAPPVIDALESDRERAEKALETLRDDLDRLDTVEADWNRITKSRETLKDWRTEIRYRIDDRIADVESEITELLDERDQCEAEVDTLTRRIESERERLTQPHVTERLAVLPIIPEQLDQLDLDTVDTTVDSLADYLDQGLIAREKLGTALNERLELNRAREASLMDRDFTGTNDTQDFPDLDETWILFAEANDDLRELVDTTTQPNVRTSDDSSLEYLRDPYRIEFVSFTHRGPISAFTYYQQLEEMAAEGHLDAMALQYEDHRDAFAYPEWYGRDKRPRPETRISVDRPPELDLECIDKPGLSEGEFKNFIKTTGLDSFLWQGTMWEEYDCEGEFTGWSDEFTELGLTFLDFQEASPEPSLKSRWLADAADWEEILTAVQENIADRHVFQVDIE